jgi:hypothetical protein
VAAAAWGDLLRMCSLLFLEPPWYLELGTCILVSVLHFVDRFQKFGDLRGEND